MIPFCFMTGTGDHEMLITVELTTAAWIFAGYEDGSRKRKGEMDKGMMKWLTFLT